MLIKAKKSPNFNKKVSKIKDIKFLIIHYTGMQSRIESITRLIDPKSKVSCHYLIDRKGKILKMVNEDRVAWHAGKSKWKNFVNLNKYSIGIELVNKGHEFGYEKFNKLQIENLIKLCIQLKKKYKIKNSNILGHSDIAPLRKQDPGEKFPWQKLNKNDLGIWYENSIIKKKKTYKKNKKNIFFSNLYKIGYRYFNKNKRLKKDVTIVKAFQRRFLPNKITGIINQKTFIISHFLANLKKI